MPKGYTFSMTIPLISFATSSKRSTTGEYGGGTVMLWDEGSWAPIGDAEKGYKKGKLDFELEGKRLKGRWHLVRLHGNRGDEKRENWLLIKGKDQYANEQDGDAALEEYQTSVVSDRSMESLATGKSKVWKGKAAEPEPAKEKAKPQRSKKEGQRSRSTRIHRAAARNACDEATGGKQLGPRSQIRWLPAGSADRQWRGDAHNA
jgi:bifunctional non-homologous end joining protein LigD